MEPRRSSRPRTQRERSNSLPIVEALGCSTPEAQLLLAEGRAAVRTRRARSHRGRPEKNITTFNPRDHLHFLNGVAPTQEPEERSTRSESRTGHARIPSTSTDCSTSTLVPQSFKDEPHNETATSPLGDYSANLAKFIKAQLKNIPTYSPNSIPPTPLSPRSCPDLSFRAQSPVLMRSIDAPRVIDIPQIRPPMQSQFSAWSSTYDETEDDMSPALDAELESSNDIFKNAERSPSILGYYNTAGESSFLFTSTPFEEEEDFNTAKGFYFDMKSTNPGLSPADLSPFDFTDDYPSSDLSRPQLESDTSSVSTSSYFELKSSLSIAPQLRDRVIAALTPPPKYGKLLTAVSPWEGSALSNVHDVVVESQHRVHVDGLSFDMQRDFVMPSHIGTPC